MPAHPALIRQSDLKRHAKALKEAGVERWRVIATPDGRHEIVVDETEDSKLGPDPDELLR